MKKMVLVERLVQYKIREVIEVEDNIDHALDEVIMNEELKEFSQKCLEPTVIVDHREISKEEYLRLFDQDNPDWMDMTEEKKFSFVNKIDYSSENADLTNWDMDWELDYLASEDDIMDI